MSALWMVSRGSAAVMALLVPVCAALVVPRRFAVALLVGWIGSAAALFVYHYLVLDYLNRETRGDVSIQPLITFSVTLLALLILAAIFGRGTSTGDLDRSTREG